MIKFKNRSTFIREKLHLANIPQNHLPSGWKDLPGCEPEMWISFLKLTRGLPMTLQFIFQLKVHSFIIAVTLAFEALTFILDALCKVIQWRNVIYSGNYLSCSFSYHYLVFFLKSILAIVDKQGCFFFNSLEEITVEVSTHDKLNVIKSPPEKVISWLYKRVFYLS